MAGRPTLWHIAVSHYSEKARWALEHKGVAHVRRAPVPGTHIPIALWLTGGAHSTFPVLEMDGERVGDSSAIIAALERSRPDPPLYPADPEQRTRALALEEFFDEELGPHVRLLVFHELSDDPERFTAFAAASAPAPLARAGAALGGYARSYTQLRFGVRDKGAADLARARIPAAFDRLEEELDGRDHLVGEDFSVADLTAAALFYPLVLPPEGPTPTELPDAFMEFRASQADRPGFRWVERTYARYRVAMSP
jgi:glutathione S-transferase